MKDRVYTAEMGQPPMDIDGASAGMGMKRPKNMAGSKRRPTEAEKKKATKKYASGGYVRAADGVAQRGKTRGKFC
jgi:hypothetical protein